MYPFNGDWTNSLFFSQDPVAMDSVMYDFLFAEGTNPSEASQNYIAKLLRTCLKKANLLKIAPGYSSNNWKRRRNH
jgi:hypothetical protein